MRNSKISAPENSDIFKNFLGIINLFKLANHFFCLCEYFSMSSKNPHKTFKRLSKKNLHSFFLMKT